MKKAPSPATLDQRRSQWFKGVLDLCVLARLSDREAYGYELAKALEAAGLGEIKGGTLYPLLNRLERDGFVTTAWESNDQGPDRKYYRVTPRGRSALSEAAGAWSDFTTTVGRVLSVPIREFT